MTDLEINTLHSPLESRGSLSRNIERPLVTIATSHVHPLRFASPSDSKEGEIDNSSLAHTPEDISPVNSKVGPRGHWRSKSAFNNNAAGYVRPPLPSFRHSVTSITGPKRINEVEKDLRSNPEESSSVSNKSNMHNAEEDCVGLRSQVDPRYGDFDPLLLRRNPVDLTKLSPHYSRFSLRRRKLRQQLDDQLESQGGEGLWGDGMTTRGDAKRILQRIMTIRDLRHKPEQLKREREIAVKGTARPGLPAGIIHATQRQRLAEARNMVQKLSEEFLEQNFGKLKKKSTNPELLSSSSNTTSPRDRHRDLSLPLDWTKLLDVLSPALPVTTCPELYETAEQTQSMRASTYVSAPLGDAQARAARQRKDAIMQQQAEFASSYEQMFSPKVYPHTTLSASSTIRDCSEVEMYSTHEEKVGPGASMAQIIRAAMGMKPTETELDHPLDRGSGIVKPGSTFHNRTANFNRFESSTSDLASALSTGTTIEAIERRPTAVRAYRVPASAPTAEAASGGSWKALTEIANRKKKAAEIVTLTRITQKKVESDDVHLKQKSRFSETDNGITDAGLKLSDSDVQLAHFKSPVSVSTTLNVPSSDDIQRNLRNHKINRSLLGKEDKEVGNNDLEGNGSEDRDGYGSLAGKHEMQTTSALLDSKPHQTQTLEASSKTSRVLSKATMKAVENSGRKAQEEVIKSAGVPIGHAAARPRMPPPHQTNKFYKSTELLSRSTPIPVMQSPVRSFLSSVFAVDSQKPKKRVPFLASTTAIPKEYQPKSLASKEELRGYQQRELNSGGFSNGSISGDVEIKASNKSLVCAAREAAEPSWILSQVRTRDRKLLPNAPAPRNYSATFGSYIVPSSATTEQQVPQVHQSTVSFELNRPSTAPNHTLNDSQADTEALTSPSLEFEEDFLPPVIDTTTPPLPALASTYAAEPKDIRELERGGGGEKVEVDDNDYEKSLPIIIETMTPVLSVLLEGATTLGEPTRHEGDSHLRRLGTGGGSRPGGPSEVIQTRRVVGFGTQYGLGPLTRDKFFVKVEEKAKYKNNKKKFLTESFASNSASISNSSAEFGIQPTETVIRENVSKVDHHQNQNDNQ